MSKERTFRKSPLVLLLSNFTLSKLLLIAIAAFTPMALAAQSLQVTYGGRGVQTIAFGNTVLEDVGRYGGDAFHIWHMRSTDLQGNVISSGQYGWGESNNGTWWNEATKTETYYFSWGSIATQFVQNGNNLDVLVTETNNAGSGILFDGAEIFPFTLHFPQDPAGFNGYSQYAITTTGPGVSAADFGTGVVTSVIPDASVALYGGWKVQGGNTYSPIFTTTFPDFIPTFLPHNNIPVQPGSSFSYRVSLRFTPEGTPASAADAYASFAAKYPSLMTWTDKRAFGTAYLASSPSNEDITQSGGFPNNPRRYFNDASVNVMTIAGLQAFQQRILTQARNNALNAQAMNAQGVITWDIEGEQYPQTTSYVCSPDQIAAVAPEMESLVIDTSSPYYGQKLDDAYFKTMSSAGLRIGLCLRPQAFTLLPNGRASQSFLSSNGEIVANLEKKARYANARWGASVFYVDSTVDSNGGVLDPAIFQQLITDFPNFLFIPEESTPRYYAYSAPFYTFLFHDETGTPSSIYNYYPNAFGANLVNDAPADRLAAAVPKLTASVAKGDILMAHADYWDAYTPPIVNIYAAAGVSGKAPVRVTPAISWSAPAHIAYGTALSGLQLNATASTAGTFVYTPGAGTVPDAGALTLATTFTPADTTNYTSATASTQLTIDQAVPVITWATPAGFAAGTALSTAQLNATANVPGSFTYSPAAGTVLNAGTATLTATFTPADTRNYTPVRSSVNLQVNAIQQVQPAITWATPASIVYGTAISAAQLNATANTAGSFSYSPGPGTVPGAGNTLLTVTFTPVDTTHFSSTSAVVNLNVAQAVPVLTWPAPAAVTSGSALGAAQLNASSNVPGSFSYTPGAGTVLNAGTTLLTALFTPNDTTNYRSAAASVSLVVTPVQQTQPNLSWSTPATIVYGTALSAAQLNATANVPGTFSYSPSFGSVPGAGNNLLTVSFTPSDATHYSSASTVVNLNVTQAAPVLGWAAPAAITEGTALSAAQLNASANVAGTFFYTPAAGTTLSAGSANLSATFVPADSANYSRATITVPLTVNAAVKPSGPLVLLSPAAGTTLSGTVVVSGSCTLPLDAAGTFLMVDGREAGTHRVFGPFVYPLDTTSLSNGPHVLQLWGHDIGNNTWLSQAIVVNIAN